MKLTFIPFLLLATHLHSGERVGFDIYLAHMAQISTKDHPEFQGQSFGISFRISNSAKSTHEFRFSAENCFNINGYNKNTTSNIRNFYALSGDYLWHSTQPIYLGLGVKASRYEVLAPPPSQFPSSSTVDFGNSNSVLPEFVFGWSFAKHFSLEINTSLVQNNLQVRYSF